jgi:flagellar protein FlbT
MFDGHVSPSRGEAKQGRPHVYSCLGAAPGRNDDRQWSPDPIQDQGSDRTGRSKARFLFGKQIMPPDQADSPARRIYFAFQTAYIGTEEERGRGLAAVRELIAEFKQATTSALACEILDRALSAAEADDCYQALKLAKRIIRHEDAVLGREPPASTPRSEALTPSHEDHRQPCKV